MVRNDLKENVNQHCKYQDYKNEITYICLVIITFFSQSIFCAFCYGGKDKKQ